MEKITKEELMENLGGETLSNDELEKVSGGDSLGYNPKGFKACKESYLSQGYSLFQATNLCVRAANGL